MLSLPSHRSPRPVVLLVLALAVVTALLLEHAAPAHAAALPSKSQWSKDVSKALAPASKTLNARVDARQPGEKLAINLDIDNTSIATHYSWPQAVAQTLALSRQLHHRGVYVLFNTGRWSTELAGIKKVLAKAGFQATSVCGRVKGLTLVQGKVNCRKIFLSRGYTLIGNIGNNGSDVQSYPYAEHDYLLPNYGGKLS